MRMMVAWNVAFKVKAQEFIHMHYNFADANGARANIIRKCVLKSYFDFSHAPTAK